MMRHQPPRPQRMFGPQRYRPNPFGRGSAPYQQANIPGNRGLLSRLFQRQGASQANAMFSRGGSQTSLLQGLANPQKISSFLGQTQQVLNTAQQISPLIQQYGPIIKNLPAMWKLYQGIKSAPDSGDNKDDVTNDEEEVENGKESDDELFLESSTDTSNQKHSSNQDKKESLTQRKRTRESVPKLYIP